MKLVKMSLAAAVLLGASAFAVDNVKVSGDAKVYYGTNNMGNNDLFEKGDEVAALTSGAGSFADAALRVGVTGDLAKGISFGATMYGVSTLGLENNLVSQTWTGAHGVTAGNGSSFAEVVGGAQVNDAAWLGELWMAATLGKTTAKLGRMELDTPLAFTEKWSVVPNTFEAAVLINQDIPDTTLVGAWVGKGNGGRNVFGVDTNTVPASVVSADQIGNPGVIGAYVGNDLGVVGPKGTFNTFGLDGAYAVAAVNNSFKPLTVQGWYYNVLNVADAFWLQGDLKCKLVPGLIAGAQYAEMSPKGTLLNAFPTLKDSSAYAGKLGYEGIEGLVVSGAYSKADKDGALSIQNVATASGQSKLYTEAYWAYGYVGAAGAESWTVAAEYDVKDVVKVGAYYTDVNNKSVALADHEMTEATLAVSTSFGPLDATLAYINTDAKDQNIKGTDTTGTAYDTVLAMLKLNF